MSAHPLVRVEGLGFRYPDARADALADVELELSAGERVCVLGPSGAGKTTLVRALAGLVPHFHGGRFRGRVAVDGLDTRRVAPARLAGAVATVFQDPEDQIVMSQVEAEVAFGPENLGVAPLEIGRRVSGALAAAGAGHLAGRRTAELSAGELQRVCLAGALALEPRLLLLDEPTSQLDPAAAAHFLGALDRQGCATLLSEHRVARAFEHADRVLFVDGGRLLLDAPASEALAWLERERPSFVPGAWANGLDLGSPAAGSPVVALRDVCFAYGERCVLDRVSLELSPGELVALEGSNGSGKSTLARIAAGLLRPDAGRVERRGRACHLGQDPGRHLIRDRVVDEAAVGVAGDRGRAIEALADVGLAGQAERHPRDLSSGERERLALACVLAPEPDLLVLDEPTRGVDPERKRELARLLAAYASQGHAVLVVTHDHDFPAHRRIALDAAPELAVA